MFEGFNLKITERELPEIDPRYKQEIEQRTRHVNNTLEEFYDADGSMDGEALKNAWFPSLNTHVFISHSHKDKEIARRLAVWLEKNIGLKCFIDSDVWGFADTLLKSIDKKYAWKPSSGFYDYNIRNYTTSHVHLMLTNALFTMMDKSECLIFINTDNALDHIPLTGEKYEARTYSPWLMSELNMSSLLERKQDPEAERELLMQAMESADESYGMDIRKSASVKIHHKASVAHLHSINADSLVRWIEKSSSESARGYDALTYLYSLFAGKDNLVNKSDAEEQTFIW